jgi:serine/threonine protein kinase/tetratricopeptide (TPR) repeat protein
MVLKDESQQHERFAIESRVGGGASGDIFRAIDQTNGQTVALKLLRVRAAPGERARFSREIAVLADLRHPNIVDYVAHGTWPDGRPFLAMEWLDGEDLAKLSRRKPLGMRDAVEVVRRTAQALAAIHARGIVHRDLKLSNIYMIAGRRTAIKLIDFGVVRPASPDAYTTEPGTILGTPHYMSPEQARGEPVDPRADVYSLGSVLFRLLTGRNVFQTDHVVALLGRLVLEDPPSPGSLRFDIPERLDEVVHRALSRDPAQRYPHAGDFARALARAGELNNDPPQTERSASQIRRRRRLDSDTGGSVGARPTYPGLGVRRIVACLVYDLGQVSSQVSISDDLSEIVGEDVRLSILASGKTVCVLGVEHSRGDEVMRAARAALQIVSQYPEARAAVATGHAIMARSNLAGEALERAAKQLDEATPGTVRLDPFAAGVLEGRFELEQDAHGAVVSAEILRGLGPRELLGKPIPTVGRENEIAQLLGVYAQTLRDSYPRVAVVLGPAGIGKSRVRSEVVQRLELTTMPPEVLLCRGDMYSQSSIGSVLGRALRAQMGVQDGAAHGEQVNLVKQFVRARLPRSLHFLAAFIGEIVGVHFPDAEDEPLRAARANQELLQSRIRMALEAYLRTRAGRVPQVIVLDDLHMCDDLTLDLIEWVLACPDLRLIVFAFSAADIDTRRPQLWQNARMCRLELAPLAAASANHIVATALPRISPMRRAKIIRRAGGNPLILEELIRGTAEGSDELPLKVEALVQRRLDRLPAAVADVVRAASVFGANFWPGGVANLLDRAVDDDFRMAERHELVMPQSSSRVADQSEWSFRQILVRDAAYASLLEDDRQRFHLAAAKWLHQVGCTDLGLIARHFDAAAERERAAKLYAQAAIQAMHNFGDMDNALELAGRGLACSPGSHERAHLLLTRAQVLIRRGELTPAAEAADQAGSLTPPASRMWVEAQRLLAACLIQSGRAAEGEARAKWALSESFALSPEQRSILLSTRVRGLADLGKGSQALQVANEAVNEAHQAQDGVRLRALDAHLFALMLQSRPDEAVAAGEALIAAADRAGDLHLASRGRINTASALNYLGRYEDAQVLLERALPDVRSFRLHILEASAIHNLGMCSARLGAIDEGIAMQAQAVHMADTCAAIRLGINARIYHGLMLSWRGAPGDLKAAADYAQSAVHLAADYPNLLAAAHYAVAFVQLTRRRLDDALVAIETCFELLGSTVVEEWDEAIHACYAEILLAHGDEKRADAILEIAFLRIAKAVALIQDPTSRRAFTERNVDVGRVLALAESRLGRRL